MLLCAYFTLAPTAMFKSISLKGTLSSSLETFSRFRYVLLLVLLRSILMICLIEGDKYPQHIKDMLTNLLLTCLLACPLMIGISMASERKASASRWKVQGFGILLLLMALYYFFGIGNSPSRIDYYRFAILLVGAHLWVAYAPFLERRESNGFWQFNKALFLEFLHATLYAITLYIGLMIALQTVRFLFEIEYLFKIEADLAVLIFSFFHSLFFLSKLPSNISSLENETNYPKGLKIFTQYVLLPLEVVYLVILYAYTGKILVEWSLPSGGVAYLVMAFSVAGIFALLLLYPLRPLTTEKWILLFSRRFYLAMLPLLVLLFAGIFRRINDYGITENRYIVVALAIWLTGFSLYFLWSKKKEIIWIPITLSLLCMLLVFGPWNIFKIAHKSQQKTFQSLIEAHNLLDENGKITKKATLESEDFEQLVSILNYFNERDSTALESYFPDSLRQVSKTDYSFNQREYLLSLISNRNSNQSQFHFGTDFEEPSDIAAFSIMVPFDTVIKKLSKKREWTFSMHQKNLIIRRHGTQVMTCDLGMKVDFLKSRYDYFTMNIPQSEMTFDTTYQGKRMRVIVQSIDVYSKDKYNAKGLLFY